MTEKIRLSDAIDKYCDPTQHSAGFCTHCICDCLRAARNATVRGVYDHLFSMGAPAVWPGALKEIRVWAKENGLEDPK